MDDPKKLRRQAEEALKIANTARYDEDRKAFRALAKTWLRTAERLESKAAHGKDRLPGQS